MIKQMLTAVFVVAATAVTAAPTVSDCRNHAENVIRPMAESRDDIPPEAALFILMTMGFPEAMAQATVMHVYGTYAENTPQEIVTIFMGECAGESL